MVRQRDEWSHRQQRSEPNSEKAEASRWSADLRELTLHMITIYLEKRSTRVNSMQIYWNVNAKVTSPFCRKGEVIVTTIFFKFQDIATSRSHGSVKHSVTTGSLRVKVTWYLTMKKFPTLWPNHPKYGYYILFINRSKITGKCEICSRHTLYIQIELTGKFEIWHTYR